MGMQLVYYGMVLTVLHVGLTVAAPALALVNPLFLPFTVVSIKIFSAWARISLLLGKSFCALAPVRTPGKWAAYLSVALFVTGLVLRGLRFMDVAPGLARMPELLTGLSLASLLSLFWFLRQMARHIGVENLDRRANWLLGATIVFILAYASTPILHAFEFGPAERGAVLIMGFSGLLLVVCYKLLLRAFKRTWAEVVWIEN